MRKMKCFYGVVFVGALFMGSVFSANAECLDAPKSGDFLAYSVEPILSESGLTLNVVLSFRLTGARSATLILPSEWEGQKDLDKAITNLEALSVGTSLQPNGQPSTLKIVFAFNQVVRLRYRVVKDWTGNIDSSKYFRVMLDPTYFQVTGNNFLVYPVLPDDKEIPISVKWENLPEGWITISSFGGNETCHSATARLVKVSNGLFAGGLLRVDKLEVGGNPIFFATRGKWEFEDKSFSDLVSGILNAERDFWHDRNFPNYLITLLPNDEAVGNYGGVALEDSFALFLSPNSSIDYSVKFLLAHEMFHSWNAGKLGEIQVDPPYWFSEGFTDYYARTLLLRAHLITSQEAVNDIEQSYREYQISPVLHASGKAARDSFLSNPDMQRILYLRGDFLALHWNALIQSKSKEKHSLDDAMRDLLAKAARQEIVLTDESLGAHFNSYLDSAIDDVHRFLQKGETIPLDSRTPQAVGQSR
jgi:predicted metalloprotease with PDZ domain